MPNIQRLQLLPAFSIELRAVGGGLSGKRAYFDIESPEVVIEGERIPNEILEIAKALKVGDGGWFDEQGRRWSP